MPNVLLRPAGAACGRALPGGLSSGEGEVCVSACRNRLFQKNKSENFKKDLQKERRCGNIHKSAEVVGRTDVCPYPNGRNARLSSGIRRTAAPIPDSGTRVHIRKRIEVVITGLTRNQVVLTGSWVRIPPAPPSKNPVTMRVSGFFLFCTRSKNHPVLGCSFHNFGKNSFLLYSPLFSALCSHLLPKSPASGRGIPLTIACAEESFEL